MKLIVLIHVLLIIINFSCNQKSKNNETKTNTYAASNSLEYNSINAGYVANKSLNYSVPTYDYNTEIRRVRNTQLALKTYATKNKCNTNYAFVIDMRLPSYKKRFFIFNLKKDSIETSGLVAHGTGSETFKGALVFSNVPESRQTSLGKYKIGASYNGMYGFSYRLAGLDSTNNKAFARAIVLHSHACVPDTEYDEYPICFSYGCPMVSTKFLQTLKGYISKQGKTPILMSIIY